MKYLLTFLAAVMGSYVGMRAYMGQYPNAPQSLSERNDAIAILWTGVGAGAAASFSLALLTLVTPSKERQFYRYAQQQAKRPELSESQQVSWQLVIKDLEDLRGDRRNG